jgi:hypothetical protein
MPDSASAATALDLFSYLMPISAAGMLRGGHFANWHLLLFVVLRIQSGYQSQA